MEIWIASYVSNDDIQDVRAAKSDTGLDKIVREWIKIFVDRFEDDEPSLTELRSALADPTVYEEDLRKLFFDFNEGASYIEVDLAPLED